MKYLVTALCWGSMAFADMQPPAIQQIPRNFRFDKMAVFNHSYIVITESVLGAQNQILHDPDCRCMKFTEEMIAKVIQEVMRLKDLEKK
jgi:hypothetical protein